MPGIVVFSAAVSVKMNVVLMAPSVPLFILKVCLKSDPFGAEAWLWGMPWWQNIKHAPDGATGALSGHMQLQVMVQKNASLLDFWRTACSSLQLPSYLQDCGFCGAVPEKAHVQALNPKYPATYATATHPSNCHTTSILSTSVLWQTIQGHKERKASQERLLYRKPLLPVAPFSHPRSRGSRVNPEPQNANHISVNQPQAPLPGLVPAHEETCAGCAMVWQRFLVSSQSSGPAVTLLLHAPSSSGPFMHSGFSWLHVQDTSAP